jgi:hypothetical protein
MGDNPTAQRIFVGQTIEQMRSSIQGMASEDARRHVATNYFGKWVEQDMFLWDSYSLEGRKHCRFKTSKTDSLAQRYAQLCPQYEGQITSWAINKRIRVRGRIVEVGWDVLLDQCEVVS